MHKLIYILVFTVLLTDTILAIEPIVNREPGASARAKINQSFVDISTLQDTMSVHGIVRRSANGSFQYYSPAQDTDIARATMFKTALTDVVNNDVLLIGPGTYDFGITGWEIVDKEFSLKGFGEVNFISTTRHSSDGSYECYTIDNDGIVDEYVLIENINFYGSCNDSEYTTGHGYNVVSNTSGEFRRCRFIFDQTLAAYGAGSSGKNIVNISGKAMLYSDCIIETYSVNDINYYSAAFHSSHRPNITMRNCTFISSPNINGDVVGGEPNAIGCFSTLQGTGRFMGTLLCRRSMADALHVGSAFDASDYLDFNIETSYQKYQFSVLVEAPHDPSGWKKFAEVDIKDGSRAYILEINAVRRNGAMYHYRYFVEGYDVGGMVATELDSTSTIGMIKIEAIDLNTDGIYFLDTAVRGFKGSLQLSGSTYQQSDGYWTQNNEMIMYDEYKPVP